MNIVGISGNLTRDGELRQTQSGSAVLSFSVAVNDRRKNMQTGQWEESTQFVDCVIFGNYASAMQPHLTKGTRVAISGKLQYRKWETKTGESRGKMEVVVKEVVTFSGGNQERHQATYGKQQPAVAAPQQAPALDMYDEEIPF